MRPPGLTLTRFTAVLGSTASASEGSAEGESITHRQLDLAQDEILRICLGQPCRLDLLTSATEIQLDDMR